MNGPPTRSRGASRTDEPGRADSSRGDARNNIDPHRVVADSPRELAPSIRMPAEGSTALAQPATKATAEKVVEQAKDLDAMSSAETRSKPTSYLSQAPVASGDDMKIEQPANPPKSTLPGDLDRQIVARIDQEKIDASAKHRTVLKEIWERRVL